jgi:hypothetical protein
MSTEQTRPAADMSDLFTFYKKRLSTQEDCCVQLGVPNEEKVQVLASTCALSLGNVRSAKPVSVECLQVKWRKVILPKARDQTVGGRMPPFEG